MKTYWEWRCSSTHSLTSALHGGEWSASRPGRFTPRERAPGTHWIRSWMGPRAVLDAVVKRKIPSPRRKSNPRTPIGGTTDTYRSFLCVLPIFHPPPPLSLSNSYHFTDLPFHIPHTTSQTLALQCVMSLVPFWRVSMVDCCTQNGSGVSAPANAVYLPPQSAINTSIDLIPWRRVVFTQIIHKQKQTYSKQNACILTGWKLGWCFMVKTSCKFAFSRDTTTAGWGLAQSV
jgi:hypothetical protein